MSFYIYRQNIGDDLSYLNYEVGVENILKFSTSSDPNKGIFRSDAHKSLQVMYKGKWFYVIIKDIHFIITNDPNNRDPKLSFLKKDKKNNRYVLAIYNKKFKLNFVKIDNNNEMELHETYQHVPINKASLFDIPDFLWQKKTAWMKPLEIEKKTTLALTPSSSLFSVSVFLAMALLVI
jgi:hypothetical protein